MLTNPYFSEPKTEQLDLSPLLKALYDVRDSVNSIKIPEERDSIGISNLDEIHLSIKREFDQFLKKLKGVLEANKVKFPDSIEVSNFPKVESFPSEISVKNLNELAGLLTELHSTLKAINFSPSISVEPPQVTVNPAIQEAPVVNVSPPDVILNIEGILKALDPLKYISDRPNKPIAVRMSDGQKFMKVIQELKQSTDALGVVYAGSSGISQDEMRTVSRESSGITIPLYDYVSRTLTAATQETYTFKSGGSSGTTVATVVVDYTDNTLSTFSAVTKT